MIKFLPEALQADPATRERFQREAKAAAVPSYRDMVQRAAETALKQLENK